MMRPLTSQKIACLYRTVVALLLASAGLVSAQQYVSVNSTTDGNGRFTYTFNLGSSPYVWGLSSDNGDIYLPSYGVLDVITPPGWADSVDANQGITFAPTAGAVYVGQPAVSFVVLSWSTATALYDQPLGSGDYQEGLIGGTLYTLPDLQGGALGYETFSFIGPEAVPEPSAAGLAGLAILLVAVALGFRVPGDQRGAA